VSFHSLESIPNLLLLSLVVPTHSDASFLFLFPSFSGMSIFTLGFDTLFFLQHYVLYPQSSTVSNPKLVTDAEVEDEVVDERTPLV